MSQKGTHYCIEMEDRVGSYFQYTTRKDIVDLAKFLNKKVREIPSNRIVKVSLYNDYIVGDKVLTDWEIENQLFIESYEERLLMAHSLNSEGLQYPLAIL